MAKQSHRLQQELVTLFGQGLTPVVTEYTSWDLDKMPLFGTIYSESNKVVTGVKIKEIGDLKLNDSYSYIRLFYMYLSQCDETRWLLMVIRRSTDQVVNNSDFI